MIFPQPTLNKKANRSKCTVRRLIQQQTIVFSTSYSRCCSHKKKKKQQQHYDRSMCTTSRKTARKGLAHQFRYTSLASAKERIARAECTERSRPKFKRQKSVRFHETIVISTNKVDQSHEDVQHTTWYSHLEYRSFLNDNRRSLRAAINNKLQAQGNKSFYYDSSEHCLRGLEACLSAQAYQQRKEAKNRIVSQVLHQQLLQRVLGFSDPETLASVSKVLSQGSQHRALLLAAFDSRMTKTSKKDIVKHS